MKILREAKRQAADVNVLLLLLSPAAGWQYCCVILSTADSPTVTQKKFETAGHNQTEIVGSWLHIYSEKEKDKT